MPTTNVSGRWVGFGLRYDHTRVGVKQEGQLEMGAKAEKFVLWGFILSCLTIIVLTS